ncbi:carbohydrate ABC transporter substrate-binding protein, CUT1 family [Fontibacillus panacisegetis]|uniref:Carbohydrate ABC transporter substrate-binding protein, CUT1 family n=1 Tax=Fontibacillus panacisegetis TaxID=670482 RepID=A0A1G7IM23_9BACL|nr:ABC transporter substrate-binding protein [Fontibacillus panacisegetis]SDF13604.1 carbohydrate ABC transporter substrate-binding protein, CUT1 family [Fontibacillus panacisegetis]
MKKVMSHFVLLIMVVSLVLSGCSKGNNSAQKNEGASNAGDEKTANVSKEVIELKYWVPFSGSDGEYMENMVKAFNESQSEIKVEFMNNNWDNYYPKLLSSLAANSAPDVAVAHVSHLAELIPTGMIQPLDELATEAGLDWSTYGKNQETSVIRDGQHIAVPLDTHAVVMYYNKKYLGDAGLLNEDGSIKMEPGAEGFTKMLETLKGSLPADVSPLIIGSNNVFTYWIWYALVQQQGGTYFKDGQPTIDTPEGKVAMELIKSWIDKGLALPDIGDNSYDIFKTSKAAVTFTGVWSTGNFESEKSLDFAAVPFPQLYAQPAAWGDSHTLIVPKQDNKEKQVAAVKFADWLADNAAMWAKAGHVPSKPAVLESEEYKALPYRASYAAVMDIVKYMPDSTKLSAVNDAVLESLVEVNYGIKSVEEGLAAAQKNADKLMSK